MSPLIDQKRRSELRARRSERREQVLAAARVAFEHQPYMETTLDSLARKAGVPQGIPAMYFATREELFLEILRQEISSWLADVRTRMDDETGSLEAASVTRLLVGTVVERRLFGQLLCLLPAVLEQNLDVSAALGFLEVRNRQMAALGQFLEERCPTLHGGDGLALVNRLLWLLAGLFPAAHPRGAAALAAAQGEPSRPLDLAAELEALLAGWLTS